MKPCHILLLSSLFIPSALNAMEKGQEDESPVRPFMQQEVIKYVKEDYTEEEISLSNETSDEIDKALRDFERQKSSFTEFVRTLAGQMDRLIPQHFYQIVNTVFSILKEDPSDKAIGRSIYFLSTLQSATDSQENKLRNFWIDNRLTFWNMALDVCMGGQYMRGKPLGERLYSALPLIFSFPKYGQEYLGNIILLKYNFILQADFDAVKLSPLDILNLEQYSTVISNTLKDFQGGRKTFRDCTTILLREIWNVNNLTESRFSQIVATIFSVLKQDKSEQAGIRAIYFLNELDKIINDPPTNHPIQYKLILLNSLQSNWQEYFKSYWYQAMDVILNGESTKDELFSQKLIRSFPLLFGFRKAGQEFLGWVLENSQIFPGSVASVPSAASSQIMTSGKEKQKE